MYTSSGLTSLSPHERIWLSYFQGHRDKDGYIDLSEISSILRGLRRARSLAKKQPISDSEKIDYEVAIIELLLQLPALFMSSQMKFQTTLFQNENSNIHQINF